MNRLKIIHTLVATAILCVAWVATAPASQRDTPRPQAADAAPGVAKGSSLSSFRLKGETTRFSPIEWYRVEDVQGTRALLIRYALTHHEYPDGTTKDGYTTYESTWVDFAEVVEYRLVNTTN